MLLEDKLYKIIGDGLAKRRSELGLTQDQVADAVKLERTSITNIEAGRQRAPLHLLYRLCAALNMETSSILPANKEVVENRTVPLDVHGEQKNVSVTVSDTSAHISDTTVEAIKQLREKI